MADYQQIIYGTSGSIALITLNRPDKLNALTPLMESEVRAAFAIAEEDRAVRGIVITGAGRGFCSGADLTSSQAREGQTLVTPAAGRFAFLWNSAKPVFAAVNGPAAGAGFTIALYCDFRYVAAGAAMLTTAFAQRGLIAEHGSAWLLPRLIGLQNAADLLLSGRKIDAGEAASMGLAHPLEAEGFVPRVLEIASSVVAGSSPRSMKVIKKQIHSALDSSFDEALQAAALEQAESFTSADFHEGVAAFRERRPAVFSGG
jgi:enoyl-CoA hydratase/carnithine racemase